MDTLILPAFIVWLGFAIIVGAAANTRGRNGGGWFILAVLISPLLAGLLLIALPRSSKETIPGHGVYFSEALPGGGIRRETRRAQEQNEKDRREGVFRPDGMIANTPYRLLPNGEADALIQGAVVRFQSIDHLCSMINANRPAEKTESGEKKEPAEVPNLDFRDEVDGVPYIINPNSTITAKTPIGVRTFGSWAAFRRATRTQRWRI
jgi:hypothetical protein